MINEIELWEQEIAESARQEEALKEASIYNFYDGEVVQEGKILKNLGKVIKNIINKKIKKQDMTKSIKNKGSRSKSEPMKFTSKKASTSDFDSLFRGEALTAEGFSDVEKEEALQYIANWISSWKGVDKDETINFYYCYGKDLNDYYHLTGDNAYPDDLPILFIPWQRLMLDGYAPVKGNFRWFSDVVDNNARREIDKGNEHYKNYHSLYGDDWFWGTCNPPEDWNK